MCIYNFINIVRSKEHCLFESKQPETNVNLDR